MSDTDSCLLPVDHIGILGPRIDALLSDWQRLGFRVVGPEELQGETSDGERTGLGQFSAHVMFEASYIELTAVENAAPSHHLAHFLGEAGGLRLLILAADSIGEARAACSDAGLAPGPIQSAAREIRYGENGTACFRWFGLPADDWPEALVAYVEHETPDRVFQREVCSHPNTALAIRRVLLAAGAIPNRYRKLAGAGAGIPIESYSVARLGDLFGEEVDGCVPFAGLAITIADIDGAARLLERREVRFRRTGAALIIPPSEAGGVGLLLEHTDDARNAPKPESLRTPAA